MSEKPASSAPPYPQDVALVSLRAVQLWMRSIGPFNRPGGMTVTFVGPYPTRQSETVGPVAAQHMDPREDLRRFVAGTTAPMEQDRDREPCNLWIAQGANGTGKTTLLECIHGLFDLTSVRPQGIFGWHADGGRTDEVAQLDLVVRLLVGGVGRTVLLSIWFGPEEPPVEWQEEVGTKRPWQTTDWARIGFVPGRTAPARGSNPLGRLILQAIRLWEGAATRASSTRWLVDPDPPPLLDGLRTLPTCLLFGAGATVAGRHVSPGTAFLPGGYRPAKRLRLEDDPKCDLLRVLRDLAAAPGGRAHLEEVVSHVRDVVPFMSRIVSPGRLERKTLFVRETDDDVDLGILWEGLVHPISMLGTGERAVLSLHVQVLLAMTEATIVLVDGIDRDTDPDRYPAVVVSLKRLARRFPGLSIIATATDPGFLDAYDPRIAEPGLVKGGELLDWRRRP